MKHGFGIKFQSNILIPNLDSVRILILEKKIVSSLLSFQWNFSKYREKRYWIHDKCSEKIRKIEVLTSLDL